MKIYIPKYVPIPTKRENENQEEYDKKVKASESLLNLNQNELINMIIQLDARLTELGG